MQCTEHLQWQPYVTSVESAQVGDTAQNETTKKNSYSELKIITSGGEKNIYLSSLSMTIY